MNRFRLLTSVLLSALRTLREQGFTRFVEAWDDIGVAYAHHRGVRGLFFDDGDAMDLQPHMADVDVGGE